MTHWRRLSMALFLLFSFGFGTFQPASGQTVPVVSIEPDSYEVDPGEEFTVAVDVSNVTGLYGFDVMITYDPAAITLLDYEPGSFLATGGIEIPIAHDPGMVQCVYSQLYPAEPQTGSGTLCLFNFQANLLDAESDLFINLAELSDIDGLLIENQIENGFVQVGEPKAEIETFIPLLLLNSGK